MAVLSAATVNAIAGSRDWRADTALWFAAVNGAALASAARVVPAMLPGGRRQGREYVALNPRRDDRAPGSFKVNLTTGRWADFASGERGGDLVSLSAYLAGCSQGEAAARLGAALGVGRGE